MGPRASEYDTEFSRSVALERDHLMDTIDAIFGRRSVRDYADHAVDETVIRRLILAAVQAPSAVNEQPWTFTVLRDQELLGRTSSDAKSYMLPLMSTDPHASHLGSRLTDPSFQIFYHAPVLVLISARSQRPWAVEDCALAAQNLMLAAYAEGLGSCWIGFAQAYLNSPEGKARLGIPNEWVPVAPIIVGHPRSVPTPVPRREPEIVWL